MTKHKLDKELDRMLLLAVRMRQILGKHSCPADHEIVGAWVDVREIINRARRLKIEVLACRQLA